MNDRDKKFSAYIELIEAIAESIHVDTRKQATRNFLSAKQKILIYGSIEVINFLPIMADFNASDPKQYDAYVELVTRMRKETAIIPFTKQISEDLIRAIT